MRLQVAASSCTSRVTARDAPAAGPPLATAQLLLQSPPPPAMRSLNDCRCADGHMHGARSFTGGDADMVLRGVNADDDCVDVMVTGAS